ncbi:hypothetical protein NBO_7g0051 [Nosema bombycis CQ1]|uniref:Uncharacterized protein n=1 Tax=Nosema bombycis (strain CQ1 / CVCC 102059) TaxID=578461 RepID=R0MQR1_NOSB1|nr:hypothetical protein NBO_7g0051 [Nosema bombycis CQ1]|eukprot:EOB15233.1 hypothetical protein NBO_7g0051 [Nosema bombycis CQ1]
MNLQYNILLSFYLLTFSQATESNIENDLTNEKSNDGKYEELRRKFNFYKSKFMNYLENQKDQAIYDLIECNNEIKRLKGQAKENMIKKRDEILLYIKGLNEKMTDFGARSKSRLKNLGKGQSDRLKRKQTIKRPDKLKSKENRNNSLEPENIEPLPIKDKETVDSKMTSTGEENEVDNPHT